MPETPSGGRPARDWKTIHLWQVQPVRDVLVIATVAGVLYLGYVLSLVTVPLLLALLLAYLFEPVVRALTGRLGFSRPGAVLGIILAVTLAVVVPVALALTWGLTSGLRTAAAIGERAVSTARYVEAEDSDAARAVYEDLPEAFWQPAASYLRELRLSLEEEPAAEGGPDAGGAALGEGPSAPPPPVPAPEAGGGQVPGLGTGAAGDAAGDGGDGPEIVVGPEPGPDPEPAPEEAAGEGVAEVVLTGVTERVREGVDRTVYVVARRALDWYDANREALNESLGQRAAAQTASAVRGIGAFVTAAGFLVFQGFLTAFFFYFLSTGYGRVLSFSGSLLPERHASRTVDLLRQMDRVIAGFIRGRLTIALIQAVVFTAGYAVIGVPAALVLGVTVGLLSVVPYAALIGVPASLVLIWLDPPSGFRGAWWWMTLAPVAFYFAGQALDDYVWTPLIQGKSTNMDTPTVLFASLAGGVLAGVYGLLIAIPVAACVKILLREVVWPRYKAWAAGDAEDPLPVSRDREGPRGES